jgi:hypothetical protein
VKHSAAPGAPGDLKAAPKLEIGDAAGTHRARLKFGANRNRILSADAGSLCGSFTTKNDALRIRIERRPAIGLPGKMKFRAGVLIRCALEENYAFEIEREAIFQFKECGVMQVFARILKNAERFASFNNQNEIRQIFRSKNRGSTGGMAQLPLTQKCEAHGLG